ncbi:MAG: DUF1080 domain-containing protein [Opitutaceae bacterium]|nr:DUF1080 domain-containing protein [Opitutaceae bacterium]
MPLSLRTWLWIAVSVSVAPVFSSAAALKNSVELGQLSDFKPAGPNWKEAASLEGNPRDEGTLTVRAGTGLIVNQPEKGAKSDLFTEWEHADLEFEGDFLLPKGSNSGIYFMGRYEIQLFDSSGVRSPGVHDLGALYQRWDASRGKGREGYDGVPPQANAARAPGLWQHLRVVFRAPRFDEKGKKVEDARFVNVEVNGYPVQIDTIATGPTRSSHYDTEAPLGPLMIQGSHGAVAFRRLRCRVPAELASILVRKPSRKSPAPLIITVGDRVRMQRGFVPFQPYKRLYACSVATPEGINFAYDLESFSLLRVWRGGFIDTSEMWEDRGFSQLAKPAGPSLTLSGAPGLALIETPESDGWPISPSPLYASDGYHLEADGTPVFRAHLSGLRLTDRISPSREATGLTRTVQCEGSLPGWSCFLMLAEAEQIAPSGTGGTGFIVGDREWYLDFPKDTAHTPLVLSRGGRQWLVVPLTKANFDKPVSYSLVW